MNIINYGIDLGTTNSAIAVLDDLKPDVISNREGAAFTPSAVWINKKGSVRVGRLAKERYEVDPDNCAIEFKRAMGMGKQAIKSFDASNIKMLPEELSAEILKSLKADVFQNRNYNLQAAVITVPAAFELPQCEATRKAAELAGFKYSPLLQEPVAASLAYGFQSESDKEFWLVYDFGGGTFDTAIIQVRDGVIQVVNHIGDNFLGGGLIDWQIIEKVFVPHLLEEHDLEDFTRGNAKWRAAFNKLKGSAEKAKIEVSRTNSSYNIYEDGLCVDDSGNEVDLDCALSPDDLEGICVTYVIQSINLCKKVLDESNLKPESVSKIIMVGGTSLLPSLRKSIKEQLGIPLEYSIDPITVVARGAAIFAGTQKLDISGEGSVEGAFKLELKNYEPVGSDIDPQIGGMISKKGCKEYNGFSVEIVDAKSGWQSGRISLASNGAFITEIHAEKGRKCEYQINLYNLQGKPQFLSPNSFSYTIGLSITSAPLTHSVGIALASNRPLWILKKGTSLPAQGHGVQHSTVSVRKSHPEDEIRIPIIEGDNPIADTNPSIGFIKIKSEQISRDIPPGADVEITLSIDESRIVTSKAYVPILDEEFSQVLKLGEIVPRQPELLEKEMVQMDQQIEIVEEKISKIGNSKAKAIYDDIQKENLKEDILNCIEAAKGDAVAAAEAEHKLRQLRAKVRAVEAELRLPELIEQAQEQYSFVQNLISDYGNDEKKTALENITNEMENAIDSSEVESLEQLIDVMYSLTFAILDRQIWFWVTRFQSLEENKTSMSDANLAEQLFDQGRRAVTNEDLESLKAVVRQLAGLLSPEEQKREEAKAYGSTII